MEIMIVSIIGMRNLEKVAVNVIKENDEQIDETIIIMLVVMIILKGPEQSLGESKLLVNGVSIKLGCG